MQLRLSIFCTITQYFSIYKIFSEEKVVNPFFPLFTWKQEKKLTYLLHTRRLLYISSIAFWCNLWILFNFYCLFRPQLFFNYIVNFAWFDFLLSKNFNWFDSPQIPLWIRIILTKFSSIRLFESFRQFHIINYSEQYFVPISSKRMSQQTSISLFFCFSRIYSIYTTPFQKMRLFSNDHISMNYSIPILLCFILIIQL